MTESKEKRIKSGQAVGCMLAAFLCVDGIGGLMELRGGTPFSFSVWTLLLWAGLTAYFDRALRKWRETGGIGPYLHGKRFRFAFLWSFLFGVLMTAGCELQWQGYTSPGFAGKGRILLRGLLIGTAVLPAADGLIAWLDRRRASGSAPEGRGEQSFPVFVGSFLFIWLCWIPVWLAYYPVIMSYDFHKQSLEALLGPRYFNDHHPLAHTWLIYAFRALGERLGSYETGFAFFSLFQQMITALALGYCCAVIYRLTRKKWAAAASALFFALFPFLSVFVMCTTKDVLFGAFFVLFLLLLTERMSSPKRGLMDGLWLAAGILMMLFRNNALYAVAAAGIFFVVFSGRKERLRALILVLLLTAGGRAALWGLKYGFQAHSGSKIEKYSVIYQSMARVGKMQRGNLTKETYELLDRYVTEECWDDYNPPLADTVKTPVQRINMDQKKSWDHMGEVFAAWLKIGMQYPNEYLDAFLDLTRGYWFPDDTSHAEMLGVGAEERMGLLYTYNSAAEESLPGMQHLSKFPWLEDRLESLLSENSYYRIPVFSNLFKPALWCWLLAFCVCYAVYARDRRLITVTIYPLCYFGTMLLGPAAIARYVFPFVLAAPLFLALLLTAPDLRGEPGEDK